MAIKKIAVIGLCAALAVAAAAAAFLIWHKHGNEEYVHTDIDHESQKRSAIRDLCQNTHYQETCVSTLTKASNASDPKALIEAGFHVAIAELGRAIGQVGTLQEAARDPRTAGAYKTCRKLLDDSGHDLRATVDRFGALFDTNDDFIVLMDDIKTWLTGALTYQDTCLDCFEGVQGEAGRKMEKLLKLSRELTINGLAIANELTGFLAPGELSSGRRLMTAHSVNQPNDYDYDYDYTGKTNGSRRLLGANGLRDYDYGYDYTGKSNGRRKLFQAMKTNGGGRVLEGRKTNTSPNVVVAQDGSGKYRTVKEALLEAPQNSNKTFVVYIKEGVYEEYVTVNRTTWSVMFLGDGPTRTRIVGNRSFIGGYETFWTSTVAIEGAGFIARDIGFENRAGPEMHQAVALRVSADMSVFHNCHIDGFQDTLYAHNHRQFYRDCTITGTIDFIFGNARAVLQNCTLVIRKPLESQKMCMVTAQGRTLVNQTSATILQSCRILPAPDYPVDDKSYKAYLGRPWKDFSRAVVMDSEIGGVINPNGWASWEGTSANLGTCWYAEVNNKGAGADVTKRVKWPGIKTVSAKGAIVFTPREFMVGDSWIADKGIPYSPGRMAHH